MSALICEKCGGMTNTAVAERMEPYRNDGKANECYLKVENGIWVKGCAWDKADPVYGKPSFERYLGSRVGAGRYVGSPKSRE